LVEIYSEKTRVAREKRAPELSWLVGLTEDFEALGIEADEDKKKDSEGKQGGATIADEWQWDTNNGGYTDNHAYVDDEVKEEYARNTVAIYPAELAALPLCQKEDAEQQEYEKDDEAYTTQEAELLADGAEDEVGALLRYELELGLSAIQVALTNNAAGANSYDGLTNVPVFGRVVFLAEEYVDTVFLVALHFVEAILYTENVGRGKQPKAKEIQYKAPCAPVEINGNKYDAQ